MNITRSQAVALSVLVSQGIVAYLLTQPDVVLPPLVKLILGCASVGLSTIALFLRIQPQPPVIQVPGGGQPVMGEEKP